MIKSTQQLYFSGYTYPGASRMRWFNIKPYYRKSNSLLHYPSKSKFTRKPIDYMYSDPINR